MTQEAQGDRDHSLLSLPKLYKILGKVPCALFCLAALSGELRVLVWALLTPHSPFLRGEGARLQQGVVYESVTRDVAQRIVRRHRARGSVALMLHEVTRTPGFTSGGK